MNGPTHTTMSLFISSDLKVAEVLFLIWKYFTAFAWENIVSACADVAINHRFIFL